MGLPLFDSLSGQNGLNQYLQRELQKLTQNPKDSPTVADSLNRMIRVISENGHLLTSNQSKQSEVIEFLKSAQVVKEFTKNGSPILERQELKKVIKQAAQRFTNSSEDNFTIYQALIAPLKEIDWAHFEKDLQNGQVRELLIQFSEQLRSNPKIEKLLLKHYPPDDPQNVKIYPASLVLQTTLVKRYPQHRHEIESMFAWIDERNIDFDELIHYFEFDRDPSQMKNCASDSRLNCVKNVCGRFPEDPVQRLYLYTILERTIELLGLKHFETLDRYLDLLAVPPLCGTELNFYEGLLNDPNQLIYEPLHVYQSLSAMMMAGLPKATVVIFLSYLRLAPSEEVQRVMLRNLEQMYRLGFLDRFSDLFGENKVTLNFLSQPNIFIGDPAVDESTVVLFAMVQGYHYYRKKGEMESFDFKSLLVELQKPSARRFIELFPEKLLGDYKLKKHLVRLYSPDLVENRWLYQPNFHISKGVLYLDVLPSHASEKPDEILDLFEYEFDRIDVQFYGQPGMDEGGLGRQLFSQTIQGLITGHSPHINFQKCGDGKWRPSGKNSEGMSDEEADNYLNLGRLIGSALMNDYPLGQLFNDKFLKALLAFSETEMTEPLDFQQKLSTLDHRQLLDFISQNIDVEPISFNLIETILMSDSRDQIFDSARELNAAWDESLLSEALQKEDVEEVKTIVRNLWSTTYKCDFEITQQIARGIEDIIDLQEFKHIPFQAFSQQLQGVVSSDIIKTNLVIESNDPAAKAALVSWFHEWLDEHQNEPETLGNLIQTFTGARAVLLPIHFRLLAADANGNELKALFAHTCFNIVDVPLKITREGLREVLDSYGRGEHLDFTQR